MVTVEKKKKIIKKFAKHATDTGSASVQAGVLTSRIDELAKHLKKHKKDLHSRRGLIKIVSERRKHLKYLERRNKREYNKIVKELGLKK